ncbi:hypothetical protein ACP70R_048825 [Stipagrostis hirtigluma subsp. patula]
MGRRGQRSKGGGGGGAKRPAAWAPGRHRAACGVARWWIRGRRGGVEASPDPSPTEPRVQPLAEVARRAVQSVEGDGGGDGRNMAPWRVAAEVATMGSVGVVGVGRTAPREGDEAPAEARAAGHAAGPRPEAAQRSAPWAVDGYGADGDGRSLDHSVEHGQGGCDGRGLGKK